MGKDHREKQVSQALNRAVFLDRDGVINRANVMDGRPYAPTVLKDFEILPRAGEALQLLHHAGFKLIIVTNQPDVASGLQTLENVQEIHRKIREAFPVDEIKACFHEDKDRCRCRKPNPGMLIEAAKRWLIDLKSSYMVGDRWKDMDAGKKAGCKTILVHYAEYTENNAEHADAVVGSLFDAAQLILKGF